MWIHGLVALALASGCRVTAVFHCETDAECDGDAGGRCEASGYCSWNDETCPDGRRYDEYASSDLAGRCIERVRCFGTGDVRELCFDAPLDETVSITSRTVNTALDGGANCTMHVASGGTSVCVISGRTIEVSSGGSLLAFGPDPLVLVAEQITIDGEVHVDSNRAAMVGAAARAGCAVGIDGANGSSSAGGGGGAGGSFAVAGADGGQGGPSTMRGIAAGAQAPTSLMGGCSGGHGGGGGGASGGGAGGAGGGAVALIASTAITVAGVVDASGAGGGAGTAGNGANGGGGGGGAGGMIVLDAPQITASGTLVANGGGGGGGGGDETSFPGDPGADASAPSTAAAGGSGGENGGGDGGDGFALGSSATTGGNGQNAKCGGGGGGGAPGVIRVYQVAPASLGGTISPPP